MTTPAKLMGDGEGLTALLLTDAESRLIRGVLESAEPSKEQGAAVRAFFAGIARATARIAAEFAEEQKKRKDGKK